MELTPTEYSARDDEYSYLFIRSPYTGKWIVKKFRGEAVGQNSFNTKVLTGRGWRSLTSVKIKEIAAYDSEDAAVFAVTQEREAQTTCT